MQRSQTLIDLPETAWRTQAALWLGPVSASTKRGETEEARRHPPHAPGRTGLAARPSRLSHPTAAGRPGVVDCHRAYVPISQIKAALCQSNNGRNGKAGRF